MILRRTKIIPVKWIPENHDSDWDGVPNYKDCQPFNPHKQHISKTMKKRIYKQPIKIATKVPGGDYYHISEKNIPKSLRKEKEKVLSMFSQKPDVISEIERVKPREIVYTKEIFGRKDVLGASVLGMPVVRTRIPKSETKYLEEQGIRTPEAEVIGGVTIHELEHVKQGKLKKYSKLMEGKYEEREGEKMAREAATKSYEKRYLYPTEEELEESKRTFMKRIFR